MFPARSAVVLSRIWRRRATTSPQGLITPLWGGSSFISTGDPHRTMDGEGGPVECSIRDKLTDTFKPTHLEVINESNMHNVPRGSETHFKVVVVSPSFENLSLIKRHRSVNDVLKNELEGPVHALSIQAKTPSQWSSNTTVTKSPPCLGGMAREQKEQQGGT